MNKLIIILFCIFSSYHLEAKPYRAQRVYGVKPARVNYGKPYYCKVKPTRTVVVVRPNSPSPQHIWIDGDWVWDNQSNQYVYVEGKWITPNYGAVWIPGHWKNTQFGWIWKKGHWR